jgi:hypothetical protein
VPELRGHLGGAVAVLGHQAREPVAQLVRCGVRQPGRQRRRAECACASLWARLLEYVAAARTAHSREVRFKGKRKWPMLQA